MRLSEFDKILRESEGLTKYEWISDYYDRLGLNCRINRHKYRDDEIIVTATSNKDNFGLSTSSKNVTGIEFSYSEAFGDARVSIILVNQKDRGKGVSRKLCLPLIELKLERITLDDESNGFWKKMEKENPQIKWDLRLDESVNIDRIKN